MNTSSSNPPPSVPFLFLENAHAAGRDAPCPAAVTHRLGAAARAAAWAEITTWPGYAATPLVRRPALARRLGLEWLGVKDESDRFGQQSFKALGGAYGVFRVLRQEIEARVSGAVVDSADLMAGRWLGYSQSFTVACATDGNHGRSVAWGARLFGCNAVIFLPRGVDPAREAAIAAHEATVWRVDDGYDAAVRMAADQAERRGWFVVADTTAAAAETGNRALAEAASAWVTQGYTVLSAEILDQLSQAERPTHLFVQAGVGALPAAVCAHMWDVLGPERPRLVVVEPLSADCHRRSAAAGQPESVPGNLETLMAGLACGAVSPQAWAVLETGADAFLAIPDAAAQAAQAMLATAEDGVPGQSVGATGAAGLAGLLVAAADPGLRAALGLDARARVLVLATEGLVDV